MDTILQIPYRDLNITDPGVVLDRSQDILVRNIQEKEHKFTTGKTGRFYGPISNLRKDLRPLLRYKEEELVGVDISNSIPYFSLQLLGEKEDEILFADLVTSSDLYEFMRKQWEEHGVEVKPKIELLKLLNQPSFYNSKSRDVFRKVFPTVEKTLCSLNSKTYPGFAMFTQKEESGFVLGLAEELIRDNIPVCTIHDALYTTKENIGEIIWRLQKKALSLYGRVIPLHYE